MNLFPYFAKQLEAVWPAVLVNSQGISYHVLQRIRVVLSLNWFISDTCSGIFIRRALWWYRTLEFARLVLPLAKLMGRNKGAFQN